MKFKNYYLKEMPHTEFLKDKFIDFKRELDKKKWMFKIIKLYKQYPDRKEELTQKLLEDKFLKLAFRIDYEKLEQKEKEFLIQSLPKEFIKNILRETEQ